MAISQSDCHSFNSLNNYFLERAMKVIQLSAFVRINASTKHEASPVDFMYVHVYALFTLGF